MSFQIAAESIRSMTVKTDFVVVCLTFHIFFLILNSVDGKMRFSVNNCAFCFSSQILFFFFISPRTL